MSLTSPMVCDMLAVLEGASPSLSINGPLEIDRRRGYVVRRGRRNRVYWDLVSVGSGDLIISFWRWFWMPSQAAAVIGEFGLWHLYRVSHVVLLIDTRYLTLGCPSESYNRHLLEVSMYTYEVQSNSVLVAFCVLRRAYRVQTSSYLGYASSSGVPAKHPQAAATDPSAWPARFQSNPVSIQ